jgi:tetratricopeptide (TPR) repeat protein
MADYYDELGDYGDIYMESANIHFARKNYSKAAADYAEGLQEYDYYENNTYMSVLHMRKGISNLFNNNVYTAATALEKSIFYDSTNREAYRYLGEAQYIQKNYSKAEKTFTTCIRLYQNLKDSLHKLYSYRGQAYFNQKKNDLALADYEMADRLKPNTVDYIVGIGQLAFEVKDNQKVVNAFTRAIAIYKPAQKNELAFAYYARGRAYHELKNKEKALQDMNKAVELVPTYAEAKNWQATITKATY